ncbi:isoprenyl transferase [Stakelama sediminis]|uniref:isoprenyl transferase n=1 Tax=Stakelama sediminis TaxID=463200 RepID=UPI0031B5A001
MSRPAPAPLAGGDGGIAGAPRHVAIIMDGNGRWAKARRLPRIAGHRQGVEAVRKVSRAARELGIEVLTLYAFSSENWRRPPAEVSDLMGLLRRFLRNEVEELVREGVRLRVIGDYRALSPDLVEMVEDVVERTRDAEGATLVIALNYGSQREILAAARRVAEAARDGVLNPDTLDEAVFETFLDTHDLPPLDLMIRTSGEQRLSNFLLWQAAYAELLFVDTLWPDFDGATLAAALSSYGMRHRRFGGL